VFGVAPAIGQWALYVRPTSRAKCLPDPQQQQQEQQQQQQQQLFQWSGQSSVTTREVTVLPLIHLIDSSTGMNYLQNQILHKKEDMIVKTAFLCDVSIRRNLCLKLQKIEKGGGTRHKPPKL